MDQQVCYVIGQDGEDLYGIACNNRAYMRKQGAQGAWYGIEKQIWENAKANNSKIQDNLVKIEENYSHTGNPEAVKTKGDSAIWGGNVSFSCSPVQSLHDSLYFPYASFINVPQEHALVPKWRTNGKRKSG